MTKPLSERLEAAISYSHNFATAKPNILRTEKEHILGLCALLTEAAAALEAAREDGARLDWLAEGFRTCTVYMSGSHAWFPGHKVRSLHGPNFRAAIDQARGKGVQS